jgi:hypothetical protein
MPPRALPRSLDILEIEASERSYEAYNACLEAESWASSTQVDRDLVLVRLIGWMMQKAPTFDGREALTSEILAGPRSSGMSSSATLGSSTLRISYAYVRGHLQSAPLADVSSSSRDKRENTVPVPPIPQLHYPSQ